MDADRVRLVFWTSIAVIGALAFWFYASAPEIDGGRARWRRWAAWGVPLAAALFRQFFHFRWYGVKTFDADDDHYVAPEPQTTQTDSRQTDRPRVSAPDQKPPRLQLDKTRTAVIEELLTHGWTIGDIRREGLLRGDNGKIGAEIDAVRQRLNIEVEPRTIPVKERGGDTRYVALDESLGILKP